MSACELCPRVCRADREAGEIGFCGVGSELRVARIAPHMWEEPCLSGSRGAGAVFFSGCSLRCAFCQNRLLSHSAKGENISDAELLDRVLALAASGVHCIDLVTPTQFSARLIPILEEIKNKTDLPVVWNSGGYERVETLRSLEGLVDVYLPDFKYASGELAEKYSAAPDYPEVAAEAVVEMYRQVGEFECDGEGIAKKGLILRHLVLPGGRHDSENVLRKLAASLPVGKIRLSLMSQYTPDFAEASPYRELHRRVTSFEYGYVLSVAQELGFEGFCQERSSASGRFTPEF